MSSAELVCKPYILCRGDAIDDPMHGLNRTFQDLLEKHFKIVFRKELDANPEIGPNIVGTVILGDFPSLQERLHLLPNLRVAANHGVGVDHIKFDILREKGIKVSNTPGVLNACTADMGMTLMLVSARNILEGVNEAMTSEPCSTFRWNYFGTDVSNATLGIIGMGNIGTEVAKRARGFNMTVLYYNRRKRDVDLEVEYCSDLYEMLPRCDFVMITCALTEETRGLIGARAFAAMKPTATLINIARGNVVNQDDLVEALENKRIRGAALDVTYPEPLPRDHPLLKMKNVVIVPHWGSATIQTRTKMYDTVVANLLAGIEGRPLPDEVYGNC